MRWLLIVCMTIIVPFLARADIKRDFEQAYALKANKEFEKALELFLNIIYDNPSQTQAYLEAACICCELHDYEQGRAVLHQLLENCIPSKLDEALNCAILLLKVGDVYESRDLFDFLHQQFPQFIEIWYNLAYTMKICGQGDKAIATLENIIAIKPDAENAQFSLGHSYLAKGDFVKGWRQHDRFLRKTKRYSPALRTWIETDRLEGKRILIRTEGGLGDTIQFFRCVGWLKARGAVVYAVVQKPLYKLFKHCIYVDKLLCAGDSLPEYDAVTTYMTLPALYNADETKMSDGIPYLVANAEIEKYWRDVISSDKRFKVGISWQADIHNDLSRLPIAHRSIPLKILLRIAQISGVSLYSLQKVEGLEPVDDTVWQQVHFFDDFDVSHGSFVDTAAIMKQMDLVVSVDSAVVHVAGTLEVPVFLLLPFFADWRWIIGRTDSPWYPTMQIFQQPVPFDWDSVVDQLIIAIQKRIEKCTLCENLID